MANPLYGSNKVDNFQDLQVLTLDSPALSAAATVYVTVPWKCKVVAVHYAVNTALTTAKSTLTLKTAAGTCGGTHEIPHEAAIGAAGKFTPTSNNEILEGETLEIENDAAPAAGQATFTVVCQAL
tara:strand:+ start:2136 stop:2510 length:375 start_codon:yes stop_codon:yes gene_type:complete